jgi:hypothetical protein
MPLQRRPIPPTKTAEEWEAEATRGAQRLPTDLDPQAPAKRGIHVRLNDYEMQKIGELADRDDLSKQQLLRRIVRYWIDSQSGPKPGP